MARCFSAKTAPQAHFELPVLFTAAAPTFGVTVRPPLRRGYATSA
jgi:hypothetical protein